MSEQDPGKYLKLLHVEYYITSLPVDLLSAGVLFVGTTVVAQCSV